MKGMTVNDAGESGNKVLELRVDIDSQSPLVDTLRYSLA
jgi:hypothetical protein